MNEVSYFSTNKKFIEYNQEQQLWLHDGIRHQALSALPLRSEIAILPLGTMPVFQSENREGHKVQSWSWATLKYMQLCNLYIS